MFNDLPRNALSTYLVGQKSNHYFFTVKAGVPLSAVLTSNYWVHIRKKFEIYDIIEVVAEDGSYEAKARIVGINKVTGIIDFRLLSQWAPAPGQAVKPVSAIKDQKFKAAWIVGNRTWAVQEVATGKYVIEGLPDKASAELKAVELDEQRQAA